MTLEQRHSNQLQSTRAASRTTRHAHKFPRRSVEVTSLPTDSIPVSVTLSPSIAIVRPIPYMTMIPDPSLPPAALPPTDFFAMLATLQKWQSSLLARLDSIQTVDRLKQLRKW